MTIDQPTSNQNLPQGLNIIIFKIQTTVLSTTPYLTWEKMSCKSPFEDT